MALAGVSTLGVTFGYGTEAAAGTKPTEFAQLTRINSIGGITIENEQIDSSSLEDLVSRYIQGRADTGGTFAVSINLTPETVTEWETLMAAYQTAAGEGKRMWFQTIVPGFDEAFFVVAQPPSVIPQPEFAQNELLVAEMNLTIEEYIGLDAKVEFGKAVNQ